MMAIGLLQSLGAILIINQTAVFFAMSFRRLAYQRGTRRTCIGAPKGDVVLDA